ncbi:MAG: NADH-quinone oxidoreductase subunit A [Deltaproteobacteria bacterium]|jgi:NADH-quinone oxidoreductase subunit A|nr:NADH-quinone oxidoreductase subunit A [Deltaproteobacteria bacterium]
MSDAWLALFVFLALSLIVPLSMVGVAWLVQVRARKDSPLKLQTYECGEDQAGPTWIQFHPRYYVLALFFVLFDVEAAFMLPWGVQVRELGVVEMTVFVLILLVGWGYAVKKGALRWQ